MVSNSIDHGKICEYGAGDYSTGLLHEVCQKNDNRLYTFESDQKWLNKVADKYPGYHWHPYRWLEDYTDLLDINHDFSCDLAFIDSYTWGTRLFCILQTFASKWKHIIVHDCDFIMGGHTEILAVAEKLGGTCTVYDQYKPSTLLITNTKLVFSPDYDAEEV
jgi:hypothetical protein